ncbi:ComF family protein [Piscibacillus sp. B03]|uniref:ComF family protein n=1 Tax=Piscibacillus sp. B03 TaxID=3457430 RepID=UPI003FCC4DF3
MYCLICYKDLEPATTWATLFEVSNKCLCEECGQQFERISNVAPFQCEKCMRSMTSDIELCGDCFAWEERFGGNDPLTRNESSFTYNTFMKDTMALFKYRGDYELINVFKEEVEQALLPFKDFAFVPIPLSEERFQERGFNQAEAIVNLSEQPTVNLLKRIHSEKQSKKSKRERIFSSNPFKVMDAPPKKVMLIDDIYTTGTTLRQAAKLILDSGAKVVRSFTLIRS